jgi:phospholipid/cholesterol/gamma-HCH transport system ATP-binding protein
VAAPDTILEVDGIVTRFGAQTVHDGVSFSLRRGELVALIGGSGTGKSVLLREIVGLQRPSGGAIRLLGTDIWSATAAELAAVRRRFGMMFQDGALFSSLDVAHNVATPIIEQLDLPREVLWPLVQLRIALAELPPDAGAKMPSELSGGMRKRAAIARALALEPEIIFLDEPGSGLDPITARAFDKLMRFLVDDLGITVFVVTHDLDTLLTVVDRVIVLANGKVLADGSVQQVMGVSDPWVQQYFSIRTMVGGSGSNTHGA